MNLINSLISGNTATTGAEIYNYGTVNANGNNLLGHSGLTESEAFGGFNPINFGTSDIVATSDKTSSATHTPTALTDILNTTLADNGGPTQTHALVADSPAIDAGDNTKLGGITTDQRGENRVVDGDLNMVATVDIGAFEECFLTGTRILTDQGEVPVEELKIGDRVQTTDGSFQPIKWVGHQTREPGQIRNPLRGYPIQIKTGALGNGLPHRDLFVSPDHALLFGGLLINAGALVNGTSICKTTPTETFVYHHIELAQHSLLVAEGTAAESYLPQKEDRPAYDNGDEYLELYPHNDILCYWPLKYPRISSMRQMPRSIRKQLAQIAQTLDSTTAGVA
ncbi:MAG: Hint domain-containing protein [Leptolyngbyaceae cyanobacterium]